jgi:uncharacterized ferritin-like protein (DUF455 family)
MSELRGAALEALAISDPQSRCDAVRALSPTQSLDPTVQLLPSRPVPGRPARPRLVAPHQVPQRAVQSTEGRAALLHAVAHIEFNAIGLALDAIWRFAGMPDQFYRDWLRVAQEETLHYTLLADHLATLGHAYGDFDAHDGLWEMAARTQDDVLDRMALVPRRLEARGLDASPVVRSKLLAVGDVAGAHILDRILRDEIGHVAVGNRWFHWLCRQRGVDPGAADHDIAVRHGIPEPRGPFNVEARRSAGFSEEELGRLQRPASVAHAIPPPD